jgi:hypothetical protein
MADDEKTVLSHIDELVAEEHELRKAHGSQRGLDADGRARLEHLERELDQCWDLLRQRRARSEYGEDPDGAHTRSEDEVESYLQ